MVVRPARAAARVCVSDQADLGHPGRGRLAERAGRAKSTELFGTGRPSMGPAGHMHEGHPMAQMMHVAFLDEAAAGRVPPRRLQAAGPRRLLHQPRPQGRRHQRWPLARHRHQAAGRTGHRSPIVTRQARPSWRRLIWAVALPSPGGRGHPCPVTPGRHRAEGSRFPCRPPRAPAGSDQGELSVF
jgi:hypothetical protein